MEKAMKIINLVLKVLMIVVMGIITLLTMAMAYIMFAPDEFPKPFRLAYQYAEEVPGYLPSGVLPAAPTATPDPHAEVHPEEVEPGQGLMVNMETKIINLADPSGRKYIRLTVVLEFAPAPVVEAESTGGGHGGESTESTTSTQETEITARMPLMDDVVITVLSTKTYEELYTADGKEALRVELLEAIQERVPDLNLISVYFTEFVVQ